MKAWDRRIAIDSVRAGDNGVAAVVTRLPPNRYRSGNRNKHLALSRVYKNVDMHVIFIKLPRNPVSFVRRTKVLRNKIHVTRPKSNKMA
jgi:hypothetical protein